MSPTTLAADSEITGAGMGGLVTAARAVEAGAASSCAREDDAVTG